MPEPELKKYPAEIFGYPYTNLSGVAQDARKNQYCPYMDRTCIKNRKSDKDIKMGVCTIGYKTSFTEKFTPVIICPKRFSLDVIKQEIEKFNFNSSEIEKKIKWISEVSMGKETGKVDYVAAYIENGKVVTFVAVEPQAAGTTGTYWQAVLEFQRHQKYLNHTYSYGINWANEFAKTMMQQAYKKGRIFEAWGKKIIFVVQDIGLAYLRKSYDISGLKEADDSDPIHLYSLKMVWNELLNTWEQILDERLSTDSDGIAKILGGITKEKYPTEETFTETILSRLHVG
jgi:Restriction endonuclease NotI